MAQSDHFRTLKSQLDQVALHCHMCLIYEDREQQVTAVAQFLGAGLKQKYKCLYIADEGAAEFVRNVLSDMGGELQKALNESASALEVLNYRDLYLTDEQIDIEKVSALARQITERAMSEGYIGVRAACDMSWVFAQDIKAKDLLIYESQINEIYKTLNLSGICQYNAGRFNQDVLDGIKKTHPVIIAGGNVSSNPDFVPADQLLASLQGQDHLNLS